MYGDYTYQIYQYLQQYLPGIANSLSAISGTVSRIESSIQSLVPDMSDLRKLLLWFFVAWLSTRILRWGYRV